jgi:hypothetical protein
MEQIDDIFDSEGRAFTDGAGKISTMALRSVRQLNVGEARSQIIISLRRH